MKDSIQKTINAYRSALEVNLPYKEYYVYLRSKWLHRGICGYITNNELNYIKLIFLIAEKVKHYLCDTPWDILLREDYTESKALSETKKVLKKRIEFLTTLLNEYE